MYVAFVVRLRDITDPTSTSECTRFYVADQDMPAAERISTALLQIKNNPTLFDRWVARRSVFKADGNVFRFCRLPWTSNDERANRVHAGPARQST